MDLYDQEIESSTSTEDQIARISIFELDQDDSSFQTYGPLIRFALHRESLAHAAVIICLDWTKPYDFISSLEKYLTILEKEIINITSSRASSSSLPASPGVSFQTQSPSHHVEKSEDSDSYVDSSKIDLLSELQSKCKVY